MAMFLANQLHMVINQRALRRERVFRDRSHPLDKWNDHDMYKKYRFTRLACINIIDLLSDELQHLTERNHALPPSLQVFIALRFYGKGSYLDESGAEPHGVSIPTAQRAVSSVTPLLCRLQDDYIKFPRTAEEVRQKQRDFMAVRPRGFPRVVGAIDCTHARLHGVTLGPDEYVYINRKGKYSINVQLVCDAKYRILNVVARWPGSTHDSRILQASRLGHAYDNGRLQGLLLGDSGYALKPWLMTPIQHPSTEAEEEYNRAHKRTRVLIEQLNGQLKNKFACLGSSGPKVKSPETACDMIVACCVLFNISKDDYVQEAQDDDDDNQPPNPDDAGDLEAPDADELLGIAVRNELVRNVFS
ncbi:LOW QUALITY PROTEIN: putative nuclease HARBI1 [Amphiura filiformis]|uniref:LOW QUALITY PROTEIN: putative nuclease HARBI1 n=1 Tax=Amphiura filiformis TaxID=82378 RepID=UPI003B21E815